MRAGEGKRGMEGVLEHGRAGIVPRRSGSPNGDLWPWVPLGCNCSKGQSVRSSDSVRRRRRLFV